MMAHSLIRGKLDGAKNDRAYSRRGATNQPKRAEKRPRRSFLFPPRFYFSNRSPRKRTFYCLPDRGFLRAERHIYHIGWEKESEEVRRKYEQGPKKYMEINQTKIENKFLESD